MGIFVTVINLITWYSTSYRKKKVNNQLKILQDNHPDLIQDMHMFLAAGIENDQTKRSVVAFQKFISTVFDDDTKKGGRVAFVRNITIALIEILPLVGIMGTLVAVLLQSKDLGSVDSLASSLSIGVGSTLVALSWTVINKIIEGVWSHTDEYTENLKSHIALFQLKANLAEETAVVNRNG